MESRRLQKRARLQVSERDTRHQHRETLEHAAPVAATEVTPEEFQCESESSDGGGAGAVARDKYMQEFTATREIPYPMAFDTTLYRRDAIIVCGFLRKLKSAPEHERVLAVCNLFLKYNSRGRLDVARPLRGDVWRSVKNNLRLVEAHGEWVRYVPSTSIDRQYVLDGVAACIRDHRGIDAIASLSYYLHAFMEHEPADIRIMLAGVSHTDMEAVNTAHVVHRCVRICHAMDGSHSSCYHALGCAILAEQKPDLNHIILESAEHGELGAYIRARPYLMPKADAVKDDSDDDNYSNSGSEESESGSGTDSYDASASEHDDVESCSSASEHEPSFNEIDDVESCSSADDMGGLSNDSAHDDEVLRRIAFSVDFTPPASSYFPPSDDEDDRAFVRQVVAIADTEGI